MEDGARAFGQFLILGAAVMAFFIAAKVLASNLPDGGFIGAVKAVVSMA